MRVIAIEHPVPLLPPADGFINPAPAEPVNVPEHSYYQRRVASGELKVVAESAAKGSAKSAAKENAQ
jgi:hypothetical protein